MQRRDIHAVKRISVPGAEDIFHIKAYPHTCYNGRYRETQYREVEQNSKAGPSSDCRLQLAYMKSELLVIADQHAAVNAFPGLVHTARHTMEVGGARSWSTIDYLRRNQ